MSDETKEWLSITMGPTGSVAKVVLNDGNLTARASVKAYHSHLEDNIGEARVQANKILDVLRKVAHR